MRSLVHQKSHEPSLGQLAKKLFRILFGTSVCWHYLEPGARYNEHFNGCKDIMVFENKSGSRGMVKNVSMSVVGSEILFVHL